MKNKSVPVFGITYASFTEAYPNIREVKIEVLEKKLPGESTWRYSTPDLPSTIPCSNPRCKNGGFYLDAAIGLAVRDGKTDGVASLKCKGSEPSGARQRRACLHSFIVKFHLEYKGTK